MGQALDDLTAKVAALEAQESTNNVVLAEVKAALDAAIAAGGGDDAALQALSDRIAKATNDMKAADDAADITPNPPEGGSPPADQAA